MTTTQEKIAIMQAHVDGKVVEARYKKHKTWDPVCSNPDWDWYNFDYRVAIDMEQKAFDVFSDACHWTHQPITEFARPSWRAVIDAVKRGEIY